MRQKLDDVGNANRIDRFTATDLDTAYRRRTRWAVEQLALAPAMRVLDAGAGLGNVSYVLERVEPRCELTSVDVDVERLGVGREAGVTSPLVACDGLRLPFADDTFDAVICSEVLEHVPDHVALASELRRVLRRGGRIVVTVPHADYPWTWDPLNKVLTRIGREPIRTGLFAGVWTEHVRLYRPAELRSLLEGAGFVVDDLDEQTSVTLPFTHLLFYGLGRALVQRGVVRSGSGQAGRPSPLLVRAVVDSIDRRNRTRAEGATRFVSLVASAH